MNRLLELCLPRLLTYEQYIQRLDSVPSSSKDIQTLEEAKQLLFSTEGVFPPSLFISAIRS